MRAVQAWICRRFDHSQPIRLAPSLNVSRRADTWTSFARFFRRLQTNKRRGWLGSGVISRCPLKVFRPHLLRCCFAPPGTCSQLGVAYRKMVRLHDSALYIRQKQQPRCKTSLDKTDVVQQTHRNMSGCCMYLFSALSVCLSSTNQNLSVSFQHPSGPCSPRSPGTAEQRDPIRTTHLINGKRQDKIHRSSVSRYLRPRERYVVHAWDFLSKHWMEPSLSACPSPSPTNG